MTKRILILSDSHYRSIYKLDLEKFDLVIHAGDINLNDVDRLKLEDNVHLTMGNCDYYNGGKIEDLFTYQDKKYLVTHGHLYLNNRFSDLENTYSSLVNYAKSKKADFVIFGHTHVQIHFTDSNIHFLNPGSFKDGNYMIIEDDKIIYYQKDKLFKVENFESKENDS